MDQEVVVKDQPVRKVMSTPVETATRRTKLSEARHILFDGLFHHLPVVDEDGKLLGLLSSNDLMRLGFEAYGVPGETVDAVLDRQFDVAEVMKTQVRTIHQDETVRRAAELLSEGTFHCLPVVDDEARLVGMLTSTDLIGYLLSQLSS